MAERSFPEPCFVCDEQRTLTPGVHPLCGYHADAIHRARSRAMDHEMDLYRYLHVLEERGELAARDRLLAILGAPRV